MPEPVHKIELVVGSDPARLLEEAARPLLEGNGAVPPLLALRQGGLRDDLLALAASRGVAGWLDPAICTLGELPAWLGASDRTPCDDFERAVILGGVLRRLAGEIFGRTVRRPEAFLRSIDRLVGELVGEGVAPEAFERALEARARADAFERERDHELALIYRDYIGTLATHGRRDGRDGLIDAARAVAADPAALSRRLGGRREIRILGLNDLRGGWRPLLSALAASPAIDRVRIYSSERLEVDGTVVAQPGPPPGAAPVVTVIAAPDAARELEEVARRIRALVDGGTPLESIAIVARQARPWLDLAAAALDRFGLPATVRRRIGLREIPVVRAVRALFAAAADGWSRHTLVELAEQPYFASELDARMINAAGFRRRIQGLRQWERTLRELAEEAAAAESREDDGERRAALPPAVRLTEAADGVARFREHADALDETRTLAEWVAWLRHFLDADPWRIAARMRELPGDRFDILRIDALGWDGIASIVRGWQRALEQWGGAEDRLSAADFQAQLAELLTGDAAYWSRSMRGVRVLEAFAAAYRPFDHVFIVGLEAGLFPVRAPISPLLDEGERQELAALGMPFEPRAVWERRERELFRTLTAAARRSLTASYSRLDASGREVTRSAFADQLVEDGGAAEVVIPASVVLTPGARVFRDPDGPVHARHALRIERMREGGQPSPWNGRIESPALLERLAVTFGDDRLWSPTQLEQFAKCPWSYFADRLLGVAKLDDPDEEMDAATRGVVLHDALRRFFDAARDRTGGPVFLRQADRSWAQEALRDALDAALAHAHGRQWLGHPALQGAKRDELARLLRGYLDFEIGEHEEMYDPRKRTAPKMVRTGVASGELAFRDIVLERNGVRFRFRGSVDRVETGVDERFESGGYVAAVDYKTTAAAAPGGGKPKAWDDEVVLQVPLYAYALTQLEAGRTIARVEYRAIRKAAAVHRLELHQFDRKQSVPVVNADAAERMERALDAVARHVTRARSGEFPAAPAPSCGCPPFCASLEICRLPGGPRRAE